MTQQLLHLLQQRQWLPLLLLQLDVLPPLLPRSLLPLLQLVHSQ
jgi:hypothetical protein